MWTGGNDFISPAMGRAALAKYANSTGNSREVYSAGGGHAVPAASDPTFQTIVDWITARAAGSSPSPAPTPAGGPSSSDDSGSTTPAPTPAASPSDDDSTDGAYSSAGVPSVVLGLVSAYWVGML